MATKAISTYTVIGNVQDGDELLGQRPNGTTVLITFNGVVYDADFASNGLLTRTASGTYASRTLTGTADKITVSNGDGVSGNPTVTIASTYVGQNSITTLGTIATGVWNGTDIAVADGGTGSSTASGARTNLGLAIGTDVQAYSAALADLASRWTVASASTASSLDFYEDTDNGTNRVRLIGPASTADVTLTLPAATDTLVGKATTDTLTNKTIDGDNNTVSNFPYDIAFNAGYDSSFVKVNAVVQTYSELVMARTGSIVGESGYVDTAPTGAALILDIEKNGVTVYNTKPQFAISGQTLTAGTLKSDGTEDFVAGDRITFKVTQIGSTEAGEGIRFTVRCKV